MKGLFFLVLMVTVFSAPAQKCAVKNVYAYKAEQMPGTIRVNDKGEQVSPKSFVTYFIYAEVVGSIKWAKAWIDGKSYSVATKEITQFPLKVGEESINQKAILIDHKPGIRLYKCELVPDDNNISLPKNAGAAKVILKGFCRKKIIYKSTNNVVNLYVNPAV